MKEKVRERKRKEKKEKERVGKYTRYKERGKENKSGESKGQKEKD